MLKFTGEQRDEVLEVVMEGVITKEDMEELRKALEFKTMQEEPISLILTFQDTEEITLKSLLENVTIVPLLKSITKVAIVSDDSLTEESIALVSDLIPGVTVLHYPLEEINLARNWLRN